MTDDLKLAGRLRKAVSVAEEGAGSLPAKEAVKLRPADWHRVTKDAQKAASAIERLVRERDEARRIERLTFKDAAEINVENDRLAKLVAEMREALKPFAAAGAKLPDDRVITEAHPEWQRCLRRFQLTVEGLKVDQFRRARTLLATTEPTPDAALRAIHEQQGG